MLGFRIRIGVVRIIRMPRPVQARLLSRMPRLMSIRLVSVRLLNSHPRVLGRVPGECSRIRLVYNTTSIILPLTPSRMIQSCSQAN